MKYRFLIHDNTTGEERVFDEDYDWRDDERYGPGEDAMLFQWQENNYACDCNRGNFFRDAAGAPDITDSDDRCGSERYTVVWAERPDGTRIEVDAP